MVAHMMSCEDAMDPELKAQLADSSLFAELTEMLRGIQENPELGEPVDPDEMPEEARRRLDAAVEREKNRKE